MKKKKHIKQKSNKTLEKKKDTASIEKKKSLRLEKMIKDQSEQLKIKNGQIKNGIEKQKIAEKQISVDTSVIRKKEQKIIKQREELLHVTRVGKLAEFVSSLAHEISQPLAAILSYAQAAQRMFAGENPQLQEILGHIIDDDKRATNVIQRLRSLLKKNKPEMVPLKINEIIRETITLVATDTSVRRIAIKTRLGSHLPLILGDRIQLQQVILNIISNSFDALESTKGPRRISVSTSRKNKKKVIVEIKDSGCGIPKKDLPRLFTHFFTNKPDGLGMGLSISRSIIEAHGGKLNAKNNPGRGANFYFTVPVYKEDDK